MFEILAAIGFAISFAWAWLTGGDEVPLTERSQVILIDSGEESALGARAFEEVLSRHRALEGDGADAVREIAARIVKAAEESFGADYDWRTELLQDDAANAFALPGGNIAVLSGLLPVAQNADGLATVIGHEVAHVIARHSAERLTQQRIADLGRLAVAVALGDMDPGTRQAVIGALGIGTQFGILMPFSRVHESEADRIGLVLMAQACFDPREAPELWRRMARAAGDGPPEFMSTHPAPQSRIENLTGWIDEALQAREAAGCPPLS
ncbi:M48 family metallopeptidase [Lutibaculum baratangense]|uniref:Zn-dependent protease with chaperone function n=1 Tax=Lutibaculum baratangense AMV1 TaxID=631454 RepID=V4RDG9_9HYPH|nr:M48 family metallopeptidase [Lutibaculum baratangense]ESR23399.1 Zn-dependent protease with chaperone function [Lutibaculum baratangense AMV1]